MNATGFQMSCVLSTRVTGQRHDGVGRAGRSGSYTERPATPSGGHGPRVSVGSGRDGHARPALLRSACTRASTSPFLTPPQPFPGGYTTAGRREKRSGGAAAVLTEPLAATSADPVAIVDAERSRNSEGRTGQDRRDESCPRPFGRSHGGRSPGRGAPDCFHYRPLYLCCTYSTSSQRAYL